MKVRRRCVAQWFRVTMVFLLLFSYGWSGLGHTQAKTGSDVSTSLHQLKLQSKIKISEDLAEKFQKHDQVTFLLKFKEQVNTAKVATEAVNEAHKNRFSSAKMELKKRTAVVSALRAKAIDTQASVKQYLQKQKKAGKVKRFKSFYIVNAMAVTGTKEVAKELSRFSKIEKILPNRTRHLITGIHSNAKEKSEKKNSNKAEASAETSDDDDIGSNIRHIGAPEVWNMGIDGTGIVIGSLDSGVQWDHPALKRKYRGFDPENPNQPKNEFNWYDAVNGQDIPYDDLGHGTHTTGTMVGSESDGTNQIGVAPGAQWISAKAFTSAGTGSDADILEAAEWLLAPKDSEGNPHPEKAPDIINNSWGGGAGLDEWFRPVVQNWRAAGIFPVFSAGNTTIFNPGGPGSVAAPANYPESFAVGATNLDDELAGFSLQGPSPYEEIKPELVAPGVGIRSSVPGSGYDGSYSGTSMAAPHISGTVALMLQADASLTVDEIENILLNTAKPLTDEAFPETPNNGYGYGLVQAFKAVSAVTSGLGTIEGQVTREGEDNEQPTYQHEAPGETYAGLEMPLQIAVQDNVSIQKVELKYRNSADDEWQSINAERISGDYQDGVYAATIPGEAVSEPSIEYKWHIVDYGENDVMSDIYHVTVKSAITVGYSTDFETAPIGWISYGENNSWEWGVPASGPDSAFSGEKVYATNLDGEYSSDTDMTLMMPPIDLPEGDAYLQYKQWYNIEDGYDNGQVFISTDRENWEALDTVTGESDGWVDGEISLSEYAGQRVYIAFHLQSDGSVTYPGWYLDDVALSDDPLYDDVEAPTYQHQVPPQTYEGMKLPLQIAVQDNISVNQVHLQYLDPQDEWQTVEAGLVSGDESNGMYSATIPANAVTGSSVSYKFQIVDYGGNEVTTNLYEVPVETGITIGYSADFESDPAWITYGTNNSWERGVPTSGPESTISGENVYATNLEGAYPEDSDAYLMMPPIQLPEGDAFLQFKHWYQYEEYGDDFGEVMVSTDQQNWETLARFSGQSTVWQFVEADLSAYAGQRIYIAFHMTSDGSIELPGWYLDDVTLSDTSIFSTQKAHLGIMPHGKDQTSLKKVKAEDMLKNKDAVKKRAVDKTEKKNKKPIDPGTIKPGEPTNVQSPVLMGETDSKSNTDAHVSSLPLEAAVSVLETGISTNTNPRNGSYSMIHPAGTYTLQADSYGFYSQTRSVEILKDGTVEANFNLQPIPKGTIDGTVTNKVTGEPIAGATLMLMEDAAITPVTTDENGHYAITAYEGDYTLHISAPAFYSKDVEITINGNDRTEQKIQLKPFIGYPGEIGYDDGTAENAREFYDAGNGWAVRMSLPAGHDKAMVTGGKFLFWNEEFPDPGGTKFQVEIWDASGPDGAPGKRIAGPVEATAIRDNTQWTVVDLSDQGVIVDGDFYMVYIQTQDDPYAPGLATDESSQPAGRSWQMVGGSWSSSPESEGNYMIRAIVNYEVTPPVITSPEDGIFTNEENITVEGEAAPTTKVTILNNGEEAASVQTTSDGTFSADITLNDGENVLTVTASTDAGTTEPSDPVTVTLDRDKPELVISSPEDGWKTNDMVVTVEGTATDDNLDRVEVNGEAANVNEDGSFSHRLLLESGENVI
ncbi:MAG TPA: S8 family serine peptidase, partial [Bacillales bacterium]